MLRRLHVVVLSLVCSLASVASLQAGVIYSSFTSDHTYSCCAGQGVTGPTTTFSGVEVGQQQLAGAFTPTGDFYLSQIDVAFWFLHNPADNNTNGFILSLNQDSGGMPGTAIETWTDLTAPTQVPGTSSLVQTVFPVSTLLLLSGNQYWIVVSPAAPNTFDVWNQGGTGGRYAKDSGSGWLAVDEPSNVIGFDVQGTPTPEPSTLTLFAVGLLGIGYGVRRLRVSSLRD